MLIRFERPCLIEDGSLFMRLFVAGLALASVAGVASADSFTFVVSPSLAPNAYGSPSFAGYQANALYAVGNGLPSYGDPASPTYFQTISGPISVASAIVTGFSSWKGNADGSGAYANEYGNRVTFGVDITSHVGKFSISQLSFSASSDDATNSLGFGYNVGDYGYSSAYVGIDYGGDGTKGGTDDVYITSGSSSQLVNEIVARGSGNSWAVYPSYPGATNQEKIDNGALAVWADARGSTIKFTGTYSISNENGSGSGSGTVVFGSALGESPVAAVTPLPGAATAGTFLLAAVGLGSRRRRRCTVG
jgi:hypothetical protein